MVIKIETRKRLCLFPGAMRVLSWNVRSCNSPDKVRLIKRCFDQVRTEIVTLKIRRG